jgi:hypothetical protein
MRRGGWRLVAVLGAAMAAGACGGSATPGPTAAPTGLPAGTYSTKSFQPQLTFTIPAGWAINADSARYFELRPAISDLVGIYAFRAPLPASQDPACPSTAVGGIGTTSTALSTWIRGLPGLDVAAPRLVTVGGLRGVELDLQIAAGWTASCPYANGLPTVALFVGPDPDFRWTVAGTERLRLDILDLPDGTTVVVDVDAFDGALMADLLSAAQPIVRSMAFKVG